MKQKWADETIEEPNLSSQNEVNYMNSAFLQLDESAVHYYKYGAGTQLLIAFHGFGDNASVFDIFGEILGADYTIYAFDLPFHGKTNWQKEWYDKSSITKIINAVLDKEGVLNFDLLGHSYGGEIVLSIVDHFQTNLRRAFLLAPSGLYTKGMKLPTLIPLWARQLLTKTLGQSTFVVRLSTFLNQVGLLDAYSFRFMQYHNRTEQRRKALWSTWLSLGAFQFNKKQLLKILQEQRTALYFILGKYDPIIPANATFQWQQDLPNSATYFIDTDHKIVRKETAELIKSLI